MVTYVLDTRNLGLRIEPTGNANKPRENVCFSNIDYAGDPVSRRSISGFIVYEVGVPVSSSEAEYIALSKAVKEVVFVVQLMRSIQISIKLPVIARVDNVGTIFMTSNITTMPCTKHVDIRYIM